MAQFSITPVMIMAGVAALEELSDAYGHEQLVAAVYTAMVHAAPSESYDASLVASNRPKPKELSEAQSLEHR